MVNSLINTLIKTHDLIDSLDSLNIDLERLEDIRSNFAICTSIVFDDIKFKKYDSLNLMLSFIYDCFINLNLNNPINNINHYYIIGLLDSLKFTLKNILNSINTYEIFLNLNSEDILNLKNSSTNSILEPNLLNESYKKLYMLNLIYIERSFTHEKYIISLTYKGELLLNYIDNKDIILNWI